MIHRTKFSKGMRYVYCETCHCTYFRNSYTVIPTYAPTDVRYGMYIYHSIIISVISLASGTTQMCIIMVHTHK